MGADEAESAACGRSPCKDDGALADHSYHIDSSDVADRVRKHYARVRADMALLNKMISPTSLARRGSA